MGCIAHTSAIKICVKCDKAQDENKFRSDGHVCRECRSRYSRDHYSRDKKPYLARSKQRNREQGALLREYIKGVKTGRPCMDCGVVYPPHILDFDHRDSSDKRDHVSTMVSRALSLETVVAEIEKCDLVCSNCHRARTWKRRHGINLLDP